MHFKFNYNHEMYQALWPGAFLFLFLLLIISGAFAQDIKEIKELQKDEIGKYIHYEVVTQLPVTADSLAFRAKAFFKLKKMDPFAVDSTALEQRGKFVINKTAYVLSHPSGEILYNFRFEIKGERYRFWLTDFSFIPYQRDRYGNFVPATVKGIPLEKTPGKLNAGEWSAYVSEAGRQSAALAAEFKEYLSASQQTKPLHKTGSLISTKSW